MRTGARPRGAGMPSPCSQRGETVGRFARAYHQRDEQRARAEAELARDVLARLPALARELRDEYGARRVGYFGSLLTGRLHPTSDVDLYVDRIRRGGYLVAVDRLVTALGCPVDLVELDRAPPSLLDRIARDGVDLHG